MRGWQLPLLVTILLVALSSLTARFVWASPFQADVEPVLSDNHRTLSVVGSGEVRAAPTVAMVELGVETVGPDVLQALEENNANVEEILEVISALGIPRTHVQTANFNIFLQHEEEFPRVVEEGAREVEARPEPRFQLSQRLNVRVEDATERLALLSALIGQVVEAGANTVYGPTFLLDDIPELREEARRRAVENAFEQAQELADLTGVEIAGIAAVSEMVQGPGPVFQEEGGFGGEGVGVGPPLQPGTVTLTEQVQIVFLLR